MRKLFLTAAGYSAALILAHYVLDYAWLPWCAAAMALTAALSLLLRGEKRLAAVIVCMASAAGFLWTWGYTELMVRPAEALVGQEKTTVVRVLDFPEEHDSYSRVRVRLVDEGLPHSVLYVYDYDNRLDAQEPGEEARMELCFVSAAERYGTQTDDNSSQGIFLRAYLKDECTVTGAWGLRVLLLPRYLTRAVKEQIQKAWPTDTAGFTSALLTGDKSAYYTDDAAYTALTAAGLSHVVAVSGMHVAFLIGAVRLITGRRRRTAFLCLPLIAVFTAMTGFTPSAVRAGLMQSMLLLAPVLKRENDPVTSLSASALLLLLINPLSIANIGLQLSFAAMAGILLLAQPLYGRLSGCCEALSLRLGKRRLRIPGGLLGIASSSVAAQVFTVPLTALYFGFVPVYAVLSNVLCIWAVSAAFVLGYLVCLLGMLFAPLGVWLAVPVSLLPRYVLRMAGWISRLPYASLYTLSNYAAWFLVFVYAVFLLSWLLRGKGKMRLVAPVCACIVAFSAVTLVFDETPDGRLTVTAVDVGQGQSIAVLQHDSTLVVDCGGIQTTENAGDCMSSYLHSQGRERVDALILTHLHADHCNGVTRLLHRVEVERLVLPANVEDPGYLEEILEAAEACGTQAHYISEDTNIQLGGLKLSVYAPLGAGEINERGLILLGSYGRFEFLITGDADTATENRLARVYALPDIELLIAGHHGSAYSTGEQLLDAARPDVAFVSVGYNTYGHPAQDTLERLNARGIEVHRTDEEGNLSISVGMEYG